MEEKVSLDKVYAPSEEVVAREVQGEFIIVPIISGIADIEDELFSLNESGRAIWNRLDGKRSLKDVADELSLEFKASSEELARDVTGIVEELLKRRILVEVKSA